MLEGRVYVKLAHQRFSSCMYSTVQSTPDDLNAH